MAEEQRPRPPIAEAFANLITTIGAVRQRDHAAAIDLKDYFTPLTETYSLLEIHDYIASRYKVDRSTEWDGNADLVEIKGDDLYKLDGRFLRYDFISLVFDYDENWSTITRFVPVLGNKAS